MHPSFLLGRKKCNCELHLFTWNIGGLRDKLDEPDNLRFVTGYDIAWLLKTKKYFYLNVPGLNVYSNISRMMVVVLRHLRYND